jgi:hypothetical protein
MRAGRCSHLRKERWEVRGDLEIATCKNFETMQIPSGKRFREINEGAGQAMPIRAVLYVLVAGGNRSMALGKRVSTNAVSGSRSLSEFPNDS